jgi:rhamnose transport system ATP-binding protein
VSRPLLTATDITKAFAGVCALERVTFDLHAGEVHALVGENGAGKSTLIKIISGAETADSGSLDIQGTSIHGADLPRMDPARAHALGIATIYQQPALFPQLTVAENIALFTGKGGAPDRRGAWHRLDWRATQRQAADLLSRVGAAIDPERLAETLSLPEQQLVEIAKAIGANARILIMDEPTASLSEAEVARLFQVIDRLRGDGVGVIYISHRLEEVLLVADRITVLRDGAIVSTMPREGCDRTRLIQAMVGRTLDAVYPTPTAAIGDVVLELRQVSSRAAGVRDVSLSLRRGEIVGLAGLVGSGRTELAQIIFGLTPADAGQILVRGVPVRIGSPDAAIAAGIAYVPEDRRQHGVVPEMSVAQNITLASLAAVSRRGLIDGTRERDVAARYVERLSIKASSPFAAVDTLSGGNQQKVALARWLSTSPSVLILDEPTQGVDVGAKAEIHRLMQELANSGLAILMISSDLPEVLGMSDRIHVMRRGTISRPLSREEADEHAVLALAYEEPETFASTQPA